MNYSKLTFAAPFVLAVLAAGCGKLPTTDNASTAVPAAPTTPAVAATPPAQAPVMQPAVVVTPPPATQEPVVESQPAVSNSSDPASVQEFAQDRRAAQDLAGYTFAQKGDFIKAMTTARDNLNQELVQLSAKVDLASDTVQTEERSKLGTLQTQLNELDAKLDQVKISTETSWDQAKADAQQAYETSRQSLQNMNARLNPLATN